MFRYVLLLIATGLLSQPAAAATIKLKETTPEVRILYEVVQSSKVVGGYGTRSVIFARPEGTPTCDSTRIIVRADTALYGIHFTSTCDVPIPIAGHHVSVRAELNVFFSLTGEADLGPPFSFKVNGVPGSPEIAEIVQIAVREMKAIVDRENLRRP